MVVLAPSPALVRRSTHRLLSVPRRPRSELRRAATQAVAASEPRPSGLSRICSFVRSNFEAVCWTAFAVYFFVGVALCQQTEEVRGLLAYLHPRASRSEAPADRRFAAGQGLHQLHHVFRCVDERAKPRRPVIPAALSRRDVRCGEPVGEQWMAQPAELPESQLALSSHCPSTPPSCLNRPAFERRRTRCHAVRPAPTPLPSQQAPCPTARSTAPTITSSFLFFPGHENF